MKVEAVYKHLDKCGVEEIKSPEKKKPIQAE
jgi:hypothetical protein